MGVVHHWSRLSPLANIILLSHDFLRSRAGATCYGQEQGAHAVGPTWSGQPTGPTASSVQGPPYLRPCASLSSTTWISHRYSRLGIDQHPFGTWNEIFAKKKKVTSTSCSRFPTFVGLKSIIHPATDGCHTTQSQLNHETVRLEHEKT